MKKHFVIYKHIHSSCSTFSTNDAILKKHGSESKLDFKLEAGTTINSKNFPELNGEVIESVDGDKKFIGISLNSDKTFYYTSAGFHQTDNHKTERYKEIVKSYTDVGFISTREIEIPEEQAYRERQRIKTEKLDKQAGLVLWMGFDVLKRNPHLYQGGFSDELFNCTHIQNYIKGGIAHGWLGKSNVRTKALDKVIEAGLVKRGLSPSMASWWITSGNGRHFGDSLEGYTKKEQIAKINAHLNSMFNLVLTYGTPSHGGTSKSTLDIDKLYDKYDVFLPEYTEKYNPKSHINILMESIKKINADKESSNLPELEYISGVLTDVFANLISNQTKKTKVVAEV